MAVKHARELGARTISICNTHGSTIPRESDAVLYTHAGPEIAVASTKAFLAQITASYLLGLYLAQLRGGTYADEAQAVDEGPAASIPAKIQTVLDQMDRVREIARFMADTRSVLFLGRHVGYPVALEGALKLKELAYIHAEGFAAGELKHGPIALIEPGQPVFVDRPLARAAEHGLHGKVVSNIQEIRARGARTIVIAEEGDEDVVPVRRRGHPRARDAAAARAAAHRRAAAGLRLRAGHGQGPGRRPAAQPRQVGHGRVERRRRDHRRRHRRRRHRAVRADPRRARRPCASGCSPRRSATSGSTPLAARFAAKEALAKALGAPVGLHWPDATVLRAPTAARTSGARHRAGPRRRRSACTTCTCPSPTTPASRRRSSSPRAEGAP